MEWRSVWEVKLPGAPDREEAGACIPSRQPRAHCGTALLGLLGRRGQDSPRSERAPEQPLNCRVCPAFTSSGPSEGWR